MRRVAVGVASMVGAGSSARNRIARPTRRRWKPSVFRILMTGAAFVVATTSIARQDVFGLLPNLDRPGVDGGLYLAAVPRPGGEFVSLEAADLLGSARGPGLLLGGFGGEDLVVLDEPVTAAPVEDGDAAPFVDRTIKGDLRPIQPPPPRFVEPEDVDDDQPDALATLPAIGEALRPDRRGVLAALPQFGDIERRRPSDAVVVAVATPLHDQGVAEGKAPDPVPAASTISDGAAYAGAAPENLAAVTSIPMLPRESGANHDGTTPSVAAMNGGRMPATTTPAVEAPVAVAALPVATSSGEGASVGSAVASTTGRAPAVDAAVLRAGLEADGRLVTRLSRRLFIPEAQVARAEQCLAEAIYFEARGEPLEGQYAVAQVVINRVRSGYYPDTICGVVYQNKQRRNACQFSFACDRIADRVNNRYAWSIATRIARDVTEGGAWLTEVGDSTHYHATYVRPRWIRDMVKLDTIGRHIFYRVRWHAPMDDAA